MAEVKIDLLSQLVKSEAFRDYVRDLCKDECFCPYRKERMMAEHIELTKKEREILIVMFKNMYEVINVCGGNIDVHGESFGVYDLFCLADKLGVGEEY